MATARDAGWEAFQRGELEEAIQLLSLACEEDPGDFQAHLALGAAYGACLRHQDAIAQLTTAVRLEPANPQARYNLGVALEKAGQPEEALTAFRQAVSLDPT